MPSQFPCLEPFRRRPDHILRRIAGRDGFLHSYTQCHFLLPYHRLPSTPAHLLLRSPLCRFRTRLCRYHAISSPPSIDLFQFHNSMNTVDMFHSLKAHASYNHLLLFVVRLLLPHTTSLRVFHIPGSDNTIADAVSRRLFHIASALHPALRISHFKPPRDAMGGAA
jgi:hypothetical protein